MSNQKQSKGITDRESLKIGAGLVTGTAAASTGLNVLAVESREDMTEPIFIQFGLKH